MADGLMDAADPLAELEAALGHRFRDRALLTQALTHSSRKPELRCSNERLEFLGDSVLGAAVSDYLYRRFPDYTEGDLTRVKSVVVSRVVLARAAREMDLGKYLLVAKGVANVPPEEPDGAAGSRRTRIARCRRPSSPTRSRRSSRRSTSTPASRPRTNSSCGTSRSRSSGPARRSPSTTPSRSCRNGSSAR